MTLWTAIVFITALGIASGMYHTHLKHRRDYRNEATAWAALEARLEAMERRMANLEALVLDDARDKRFEALHRE
jgi:hypothetical protein